MEAEGLEGLLVTHLPNIRYLTGFTGSAALLLIRADATILISDFRYAAQAPAEVGHHHDGGDRSAECLGTAGPGPGRLVPSGHLGIEAHSLTVRDAERVSGLTRARVFPTADLVEVLRAVKSPEEVAAIRAAADSGPGWHWQRCCRGYGRDRQEMEIGAALEAGASPPWKRVAPVSYDRGLGPAVGARLTRGPATGSCRPGSCCCLTSARK